ncbi:DNA polymerase/3'-5' exonuclease PolX [Syntrophothermus lipocalidus]|uniref:DNA-directed DNA polymerase n=1 Tax=Syntrophothermus lipocalidus (strain DSM 12680 / TGB-C1) TaxID=643648 RepID=D7CP45_SYNLT|nr:DNA polymerase/3'-5' exonuclease PolX [Syntrophothermus lipocalidus]ADI02480.1 PHP domain protein [Syntrophothermus lipocalidus DSM 12680]
MMDNQEIARILDEIADILDILGENPFKARAYRQVANHIYRMETDLHEVSKHHGLEGIPGAGKAIRAKLQELLETGDLKYYRELQEKVPPGVLEMLAIPGLGPKTVGAIYAQTGIDTLEKLYRAAQEKRIRELPGMGAKTEYNIKKGIEMLRSTRDSFNLGTVLPLALEFKNFLSGFDCVQIVEITGSVRRGKPVVGDIDILVGSAEEEAVREKVRRFRRVQEITEEKPGHVKGRLRPGIVFEVLIVPFGEFWRALVISTGSKTHREQIQPALDTFDCSSAHSEEDVYRLLSMQYIPPELREGRGEIELARNFALPHLVTLEDIKGDLHIHTDWSDGAHSLREMVAAAAKLGYSYMAVTEHSRSLAVSRGLDVERLLAQGKLVEELNRENDGFKILTGIEVDILKDGSLDLPDEVLANLDVVIASIHSHFRLSRAEQTERVLKAVENPHVDIIGHLTGRLLGRRPGYEIDIEAVLKAAAQTRTALEINSYPDRLDIDEETAFKAKAKGIKIAISSDAHHRADLGLIKYGVINARRGWLSKEDVLNTLETEELMAYLRNK